MRDALARIWAPTQSSVNFESMFDAQITKFGLLANTVTVNIIWNTSGIFHIQYPQKGIIINLLDQSNDDKKENRKYLAKCPSSRTMQVCI